MILQLCGLQRSDSMFRKSCLLLLLLLVSILPVTSFADEAENFSRQRSTSTTFSYVGDAAEVFLRGEWDWPMETPLTENSGIWSVDMDLAAGMYCYKFVVDGEWILDPENTETTWCDGFENSLVRVARHSLPLLSLSSFAVQDGELQALIEFSSSSDVDAPVLVEAELEIGQGDLQTTWFEQNWSLHISASGLMEGKYRIRVSASDTSGVDAEDILLSFWVEENVFQWDDSLIYMMMTDRFVNGNSSNDPLPLEGAANGGDWLGGDLEGVISRLDEIEELGFNTIWLSPFNQGPDSLEYAADGVHQVAGYHGYWPVEPRSIDSRLGEEWHLENLISQAHERGIRVMADMVINHVHEDHPYYSEHPDWFSDGCICGSSACDWTERRLDCLFMPYMPDVDWRNRNASEQFIEDIIWWVERFDLDALRLDAVKHVDDNAINNIAARLSERFELTGTTLYLKGETAMGWSGDNIEDNLEQYQTINRYMGDGGLGGQADFVLYHAVVDNVLSSGNMGLVHLDHWTWQSTQQYSEGAVMVPYVGSHDVPRFISRADPDSTGTWNQWDNLPGEVSNSLAYERWHLAMAWLLTIPGAPMLYAGDEFAMPGGADPDNRRMFSASGDLDEWVGQLAQARMEHEPLRRGEYVQLEAEEDVMAFARQTESEHVVVVLSTGGDVLDLSAHTWLGDMQDILGNATLNDGIMRLNGQRSAIFVIESDGTELNQSNPDDNNSGQGNNATGNSTVEDNGSDANNTVDGNASANETNCPLSDCPVCSTGRESYTYTDEQGCDICACRDIDAKEEVDKMSSGDSVYGYMRWILLSGIILAVAAIFILGRDEQQPE